VYAEGEHGAPVQSLGPRLGDEIRRSCKANLDKTESQLSPFDKLRAGSAGLNLEMTFSHMLFAQIFVGSLRPD
jgi:hypothetical protein